MNGQQLYNEGKELEEIEAERAKERQGTRTDLQPNIVENLPQSKTRDIVASTIGLGSGKQWDSLHNFNFTPVVKLAKLKT